MREDTRRLYDVLDAVAAIERHATIAREDFDQNELIQVWVVHHIEIIGEAVRAMSAELKAKYPQVPWGPIGAMRNFLIHQYFGVDLEEVWSVVQRDLQPLKAQIQGILGQLVEEGEP